jgi:hypothetical protein
MTSWKAEAFHLDNLLRRADAEIERLQAQNQILVAAIRDIAAETTWPDTERGFKAAISNIARILSGARQALEEK